MESFQQRHQVLIRADSGVKRASNKEEGRGMGLKNNRLLRIESVNISTCHRCNVGCFETSLVMQEFSGRPVLDKNHVHVGSRLGLLLDTYRSLHLYVDGKDRGLIAPYIPDPCYFMFDLFSYCRKVLYSFCRPSMSLLVRLVIPLQLKRCKNL